MNWRFKVAAYHLLSLLPGGAALYRFAQENVTQSLVPTPERLKQKIAVGLHYFDWLERNGCKDRLLEGTHLDFGSGWHPTIPLLYYCLGVNRQLLCDIAPVFSAKMVAQATDAFLCIVNDPAWPQRVKLRRQPPEFSGGDWRKYFEKMGIFYHAPYINVLPSLAGTVDVITSTQVLYYIPRESLSRCFGQLHATLKSKGLFLATVHLRDTLTGNLNDGVASYEHLKYSPETWERWFNSRIIGFNRLKAPDYRELLEKAGFEIQHFEVEPGTEEDAKALDKIRIAPCFQHYSREDLLARHLFFVARRS